nr:transporter [uncultured Mogibacterium sp.]
MKAIEALFPVFFMLFLGLLARKRQWITFAQNEGAKKLVFTILFPLLVYKVLVSSELKSTFLVQIIYMDIIWLVILFIGFKLTRFTGEKYAHISPYLLVTCEGGNVALPLYISIVGTAHAVNIVTFDVAGILINFGVLPIIVTKKVVGQVEWKELLKKIFTSSFMIAVIGGVFMNLTGLHKMIIGMGLEATFNSTMELAITPITGIILFTLGYELKFQKEMISSLARLALVRLVLCSIIIGLFYVVFPELVAEKVFEIAILLYFMCPTGFPVPLQVQSLVTSEDDESYMSAFISLFLVIALISYTLITIFVA